MPKSVVAAGDKQDMWGKGDATFPEELGGAGASEHQRMFLQEHLSRFAFGSCKTEEVFLQEHCGKL